MENTVIRNNVTENENGATIKVRGYNDSETTTLILKEGTKIYNNKAGKGAAIYVYFATDTAIAKVLMEDESAIYNNEATIAGDDIFVDCPDKDYSNLQIDLIDAEKMNVIGINNWYYDYEDARFSKSDIVTLYDKTKDREVLALKAAGINKIVYETNSEYELKNTENLLLKTYVEGNITDEIPKKDGYEFIEWNTKADGTGKSIKPGELYSGVEGYTLYAQYKKIESIENNTVNNTVNNNIVNNNVTNNVVANIANETEESTVLESSNFSNTQTVNVGNTNNNENRILIIIGILLIIFGIGAIVYGKKSKKGKR